MKGQHILSLSPTPSQTYLTQPAFSQLRNSISSLFGYSLCSHMSFMLSFAPVEIPHRLELNFRPGYSTQQNPALSVTNSSEKWPNILRKSTNR